MSLNSDLQTLKTNIEGVKSTLYTNLTNKGVTSITESDTLSTLANKVSTITASGSVFDFTQIGYDTELSEELNANINADIAYSKTLLDAWNPSYTSADSLYFLDKKLVYAPNIDTSNVNNMYQMFYGCSSLISVPLINTSKVNTMQQMFSGCVNIKELPLFDTRQVNNMKRMLDNCTSLTTIEGISFKSFADSTMDKYYIVGPSKNKSLRKALFKDIGYQSTAVQFNTEYIENWGVNTDEIPDARQSLIDSLITYSFDRLSAGYPTCTITLSTNTKALLTEDEKAQIESKGFTIA